MCLECGCGEHTALVCPDCGGRVILINGETKCLSCGASPSLEVASRGEEVHQSRHRDHVEQERVDAYDGVDAGAREELLAKLRVLLPHWIEHNEEHAESFLAWARRTRAAGDDHLAVHIEQAAQKVAAANRDLEGLMEHLGATVSEHPHLHHDHSH